MALTAIPIHPSNMAPGHCPWCRRPARHRHCDECYWLVCRNCGVTWSERTGGWFSEAGLQGNRNTDPIVALDQVIDSTTKKVSGDGAVS